MAVESAADLGVFFNTSDFAITASYTVAGGSAANVDGIFDKEFYEADSGGTIPVVGEQPRFTCKKSDMPNVLSGDTIVINSVNYSIEVVQERPQVLGADIVFLVLAEA
tara:strand:- start:6860 stop:7183 length:324 start_codon:yes stop_codon:yes gene_type:complete